MGDGNGAAGSTYLTLAFKNVGSTTCTLFGYPGVSYVAGSQGTQVGSPASRVAGPDGSATPHTVDLAPGGTADSTLREVDVDNYPGSSCIKTAVTGLRVYPPGQTAALFVPQATFGCAVTGPDQLEISFVIPG